MNVKSNKKRVLVVGVYLPDIPNYAAEISRQLMQSATCDVELRWTAIGQSEVPVDLQEWTVVAQASKAPKFQLINAMISEQDRAENDFIIVVDDDIELPENFLDDFLHMQAQYQLALAQPARTHDSYIDHQFVAQLLGVEARQTRFVEIGPVFSLAKSAFPVLLPFDEAAPMGWGLDFVWPAQLEQAGLRQGIVDITPVRHALRAPVTHYSYDETQRGMLTFLAENKHLPHSEAFLALETYPLRAEQQL